MITVSMYGRLGNHMWQYAVCRTVAERNGYEYHIPNDFINIFQCDVGVNDCQVQQHYPCENNREFMQQFDPNVFSIKDFTKLDGFFQSEKYIIQNRDNILEWFNLPVDEELLEIIGLTENICVISFRGGDYSQLPHVFLSKKYYDDAILRMKELNPNMEFIVITDDLILAHQFFPEFDKYNFGIPNDLMILMQSNYLIIPNSTFSWWGAWLNTKVKKIIAPKYWFRHNELKGYGEWGDNYWCPADSLTSRFDYLDREGQYFTYNQCLDELTEYNYLNHYDIRYNTHI